MSTPGAGPGTSWSSAAATPRWWRDHRAGRGRPGCCCSNARPPPSAAATAATRATSAACTRRRRVHPGRVPLRRAVGRPVRRRQRPGRRGAGLVHRRESARSRLDDRARGAVAAAAARHAAPRADQPVLPRRRQGPGQHLLPDGRAAGRHGRVRAPVEELEFGGNGARPWWSRAGTLGTRSGSRRGPSSARAAASRRTSTGCAGTGAPRPRTTSSAARRTTTGGSSPRCSTRAPRRPARSAASTRSRSTRGARFDGGHRHPARHHPVRHRGQPRGERFYDEGEDLWPKRYAIWGRNIAAQPGQIAYSICGTRRSTACSCRRCTALRRPTRRRAGGRARPRPGRGRHHGGEVQRASPDARQRSTRPGSTAADGRPDAAQEQLGAAASTRRRSTASPMRPGITFTYMGVRSTADARVRTADGGDVRQRVRGRRDHVGQHPVVGLPGAGSG